MTDLLTLLRRRERLQHIARISELVAIIGWLILAVVLFMATTPASPL